MSIREKTLRSRMNSGTGVEFLENGNCGNLPDPASFRRRGPAGTLVPWLELGQHGTLQVLWCLEAASDPVYIFLIHLLGFLPILLFPSDCPCGNALSPSSSATDERLLLKDWNEDQSGGRRLRPSCYAHRWSHAVGRRVCPGIPLDDRSDRSALTLGTAKRPPSATY